ncbi:hypothetical protein BV898_07914 [Hypsibius exemplaris]|uniref:Uncharacterized protein n=1 Tax=Hypsibius exemplaris TaxID=2072580 RepID=A0A1W0WRZ7_HYPEX|nr:hypothetical protein BV898_07914 [Hypsibius exemplaris]
MPQRRGGAPVYSHAEGPSYSVKCHAIWSPERNEILQFGADGPLNYNITVTVDSGNPTLDPVKFPVFGSFVERGESTFFIKDKAVYLADGGCYTFPKKVKKARKERLSSAT